jgi:tRNA-dihydrouridine synthase
VTDEDVENLAMFTNNTGAGAAVVHARKMRELTHTAE